MTLKSVASKKQLKTASIYVYILRLYIMCYIIVYRLYIVNYECYT